MNYRNLGKWGLKVSEVSLGSWVTDLAGTEAEKVALQTAVSYTHLTLPTNSRV